MLDAWLIHGLWFFVGAAVGFFIAALMAVSGQVSRDEEERDARHPDS